MHDTGDRRRIKVCHIITGLDRNGAQVALLTLIRQSIGLNIEHYVIGLTSNQSISADLTRLNIAHESLHFNRWWQFFFKFPQLLCRLSITRPDLVHTWLHHSNLIGGLAAKLAGIKRIIWGVHSAARQGNHDAVNLIRKVESFLSKSVPRRIVYCSHSSMSSHGGNRYPEGRSVVIPNGIDVDSFKPDADARSSLCRELNLPGANVLIGLAARFHAVKRHDLFLNAAALLIQNDPHVSFILCGSKVERGNARLDEILSAHDGLGKCTHLLGERTDMARITAALDISTCCSDSESFSMAMVEGLACNKLCVCSDLPGPREVLGDHARYFRPGSAAELASQWKLAIEKMRRGEAGERPASTHDYVVDKYSHRAMANSYIELYRSVVAEDQA